ncbi:MAG: MaoC/PaaZ C-terminal domain-containing protein [Pseudomonadota bacterium]
MSECATGFASMAVGQPLPSLRVPITVTSVAAAAIATRDYQPVHHDLERARALGSQTVFTSTHTTAAYLERLVLQWAGPTAFLKSLKLRLGVPNYAGDELVLDGQVTAIDAATRQVSVAAVGRNSRGDHVTASLVVEIKEARRE